MSDLKAPFPYFGGKSMIASIVWRALGQPAHYIEPFFGSGAVLLARPDYNPAVHTESVCDKDGFLANVWRALQFDSNEVAKWCDWPVNHADLAARKKELIKNESRLLENLIAEPEWYDAKMAGYWIWAASCWIGSGLTRIGAIPNLGRAGNGVHKISLGKRPHLSDTGKGVHGKTKNIYDWFTELSNRLRRVRVVCGDWSRVCGGDWQDKIGEVGIFFDPPYGAKANRDSKIYHKDSLDVADEVREWCLKRGKKKSYKIVLAGYFEEHKSLLNAGWKDYRWSAGNGYSASENKNRHEETLFMSPYCNEINQEVQNEFDFDD
jgi:DNA adenine methylase